MELTMKCLSTFAEKNFSVAFSLGVYFMGRGMYVSWSIDIEEKESKRRQVRKQKSETTLDVGRVR